MNVVLLTAAGSGTRMHMDIPKQFIHVHDKPIIVYTMEAFQKHPSIDAIIVVTIESWMQVIWDYAKKYKISKLRWVVPGGMTGQESITNGLKYLSKELNEKDVMTIHDGNRPLVTSEIISDSFAVFNKYGNAVAAVPCTEVVFESNDGISSHVSTDREKLFRTQTPHTYRYMDILDAYLQAEKLGMTSLAAAPMLMKELGRESYFSKGSEINLKITTQDDLKIFKALWEQNNDL